MASVAPEPRPGPSPPLSDVVPSYSGGPSSLGKDRKGGRQSGGNAGDRRKHTSGHISEKSGHTSSTLQSPDGRRLKKTAGDRLRERCRQLCDSWRFTAATTALTLYALFGDDFRLAATHLRTDPLFDVLTCGCILVFTIEIFAASIGRDEYFMGFFFMLDFLSTVTLIADLTWVGDALFCSNAEGGSALKTSRAGRAGARAGRTVRIIRLIRLVKLYKSYTQSLERKSAGNQEGEDGSRHGSSVVMPGEEADEDPDAFEEGKDPGDEDQSKQAKPNAETRVGKKLSDMTTRRVIILVLVQLVSMNLFTAQSYGFDEFRTSADVGIDFVYSRWRAWCPATLELMRPWCFDPEDVTLVPTEERALARLHYEEYLLQYMYLHRKSTDNLWRLFWLGLNSTTATAGDEHPNGLGGEMQAKNHLSTIAQLDSPQLLGNFSGAAEWDSQFSRSDWETEVFPLPDSVKQRLTQPWRERCLSTFVGVPITDSVDNEDDLRCSMDTELRCSERDYVLPRAKSANETLHLEMLFVYDTRGSTQLEAGLSILQTIFICFVIGFGAMSFSNDANQLLLNPIERMIAKMETIKDNPLEAMRLGDIEFRREELELARLKEQANRKGRCRKCWFRYSNMRKTKEPMETVILEKTIIKLGGLLALGFGEAGAEIIGQNMKGGHSAGVNAVVPGQKVDAIIGFCSIRNFTDATEVLKEKVMLFVNQVGEIVHGCVDDYHGAPNRNIGDSFLLVWRLSGSAAQRQTKLADMSLLSFVRIVAAINKSPVLAEYRGHPGLQQRVHDYRVKLGFGLHCGWAIEGAIGSDIKIDASYLSPNVNVAARLEAATKQFGTWLLVSHFMVNLCSREMGLVCRLIDHVTVKGSKQPIRLYTIDVDYMQLEVVHKSMDRVIKNRFKVRQVREARKTEKWAEEFKVWQAFKVDEDLLKMRSTFTEEFFQRFSMAYRNYEAGEWMVARDMLFTCHYAASSSLDGETEEWPEDGPVVTLLGFMKQHRYEAPPEWPGHRELTEK